MGSKSLVILKPDAVERGYVDEITQIILDEGFVIEKSDTRVLKEEVLRIHYSNLRDRPYVLEQVIEFMTSGPSVVLSISHPDKDVDVVGEVMAKCGSFHGVFVPLLDTDNQNYAALVGEAYTSEGAIELSEWFQTYIYQFIKNGDPNSDTLPEWTEWTEENRDILFMNADQSNATAEIGQNNFTYEDVLNAIDEDTTISQEEKEALLTKVLNGRWFSGRLNEEYGNTTNFYE